MLPELGKCFEHSCILVQHIMAKPRRLLSIVSEDKRGHSPSESSARTVAPIPMGQNCTRPPNAATLSQPARPD